jgi:hypothetical protein
VLGAIIFATLLAAWPGSRGMLQGGLAAGPSDRQPAAAAFTISAAAIRPMEAVAASLAPEPPEPTSEALPTEEPAPAVAAVEPEAVADLSSQPPPEPEPAPEPIVAAGEALPQEATGQQVSVESQPEPASAPVPTDATPPRVTAVGDSVMLAAAGDLALAITGIEIDAEVGRPVSAAIDVLRALYNASQLGDVVVVHIGNNSPFSSSQFDEMMELMTGVSRVVFVNLKVPKGWEDPNNAVLAEGVTRYPNAVLADWYSASVDHPEFFLDGVHLRPEGVQAYAQLIAAYVGTP